MPDVKLCRNCEDTIVLTLHGEDDLGGHGRGVEVVVALAAEHGVVVVRGGEEGVRVPRLAPRGRVGGVDEDVVAVPRDLGQRVAAAGLADEGHGLAEADRLALDVAGDLRGTGRVWKGGESIKMSSHTNYRVNKSKKHNRGRCLSWGTDCREFLLHINQAWVRELCDPIERGSFVQLLDEWAAIIKWYG